MFGIGIPELMIIAIIAAIIVFIVFIFKLMSGKPKEMFCPNCGTKDMAKRKTKGSIFIEIILWICFFVPGVIYTIWRVSNRYYACPACGGDAMIPAESPRAKQMLSG